MLQKQQGWIKATIEQAILSSLIRDLYKDINVYLLLVINKKE